MQAGSLDKRVQIKMKSTQQDSIGQSMNVWVDVAKVWANIRNQTGSAAIRGGAESSLVKASIRIRRRSGIDAGMRVIHGNTVYDIKAVLPDEEANDRIDLVCEVVK